MADAVFYGSGGKQKKGKTYFWQFQLRLKTNVKPGKPCLSSFQSLKPLLSQRLRIVHFEFRSDIQSDLRHIMKLFSSKNCYRMLFLNHLIVSPIPSSSVILGDHFSSCCALEMSKQKAVLLLGFDRSCSTFKELPAIFIIF